MKDSVFDSLSYSHFAAMFVVPFTVIPGISLWFLAILRVAIFFT